MQLWREELRDRFEEGEFTSESKEGTLQATARAVGVGQTCKKILELDANSIEKELSDEERVGVAASRPGGPN